VWVAGEGEGRRREADRDGIFGLVGILQVDWIPLSVGSVRPTQGRTVGLAQVSQLDIDYAGPRITCVD
jgi:hypothetical protein